MTLSGYLHESGFSADPFADTEDGDLFFVTPQLAQRLDLLEHLVLYSDLLLVVIGAAGSGKTTLLNRLVGATTQPWRVSVVQAHTETELAQLLARAMEGFDMTGAGRSVGEQTDQLRQAAEGWRSRSQVPVLAIDEAHMLPPDTLAAVVRLATETGNSGLRILMLGEPQLADMINAAAGGGSGQNMAHLVDIPEFNAAQAADYLRHRLRCAGLDAEALFPDDVANRLFRGTTGLPGRLNAAARDQLADRLASVGELPATPRPGRLPLWRRGPVQALSAVLLLVLASVLWFTALDRAPLPHGLTRVPQGELAGPSPIVYGPPPGEAHAPSSARVIPLEAAEPQAPPTEEVALVAEPAGTSVEPVTESAAIEEAVPRPLPLQMPPEEPASIVPEPDPAIDVQAPAATKAAFLEPSPALATRKPAIGKDVQQRTVTEPVRTSAAEPAARQPAASGLQDEVWLLAQDPGHYTVQLTGTHDRQAALSFIRNHALKDKAAWFRTRYKDRDWYVVVTGAYSKREKAQAAIRTLPAGLKQQGPWPRTFASIQASVAIAND